MLKVMVVDDSVAYRSQIPVALKNTAEVEVTATANNGKVALYKLAQESVDVLTLDLEMPEMDGLATLAELQKMPQPPKVIVFAAMTTDGAQKTMDAFKLGALHVVTKPGGNNTSLQAAIESIRDQLVPIFRQLCPKVKSGLPDIGLTNDHEIKAKLPEKPFVKVNLEIFSPQAIAIGSSTGGPPALETLLAGLHGKLDVPVFVAQHMPPVFTKIMAERLQEKVGVSVREAKNGEEAQSGQVYVAPGDYHMRLELQDDQVRILLDQGPKVHAVRPAVDVLFRSVVEAYGNRALGILLTGMGYDGAEGCYQLKDAGSGVLIQDEESSVVWGMPGAAHSVGAYDQMLGIDACASLIGRINTNSARVVGTKSTEQKKSA